MPTTHEKAAYFFFAWVKLVIYAYGLNGLKNQNKTKKNYQLSGIAFDPNKTKNSHD